MIGYATISESTLTADRVLFPIGEYPFLAENGYATTGAYRIHTSNLYAAIVACPILAKNGYAAIGESTLTADRVLFPIEE